jgi:integrase
LVVCQDDGRVRSCDNLTKGFLRSRRQIRLAVNFHALRHSHATILLQQGVNTKIVSERLGHNSTRITQDLYQHVMPHMEEVAAGAG